MKKYCIISGGLGYIGLHLCYSLLKNYKVILIDNLSNSSLKNLKYFKNKKNLIFYKLDIKNTKKILLKIKEIKKIHLFVHLSADKYVSSNLTKHLGSISQTLSVLEICNIKKVDKLFYSSSASVYGDSYEKNILSSYGKSKIICEDLIKNFFSKTYIIGRIYNPYGSRFPGTKFGEQLPVIEKIIDSLRNKKNFTVHTNKYTRDKSGYRDFIEINDLIIQILYLMKTNKSITCDLCTGKSISVIEILNKIKIKSILFKNKSHNDISFSKGNVLNKFNYSRKEILEKILDYINQ